MADQFPDFPRAKLLFDQPLVIEPLSRITATLKDGTSLWIQREDCTSGLALGGNKVRKLEYVIADALAQGADTLVTTGGVQSNHMSQTSAAAARYGLKVGRTRETTHNPACSQPYSRLLYIPGMRLIRTMPSINMLAMFKFRGFMEQNAFPLEQLKMR